MDNKKTVEALGAINARNVLLELLAKMPSRKEYLKEVAMLIKDWSGVSYAGIRILDGEGHIPYEACLGFSKKFWESENCLSIKKDQCVCTRIISGKIESQDRSAITRGGSFCSGNTLSFVSNLTPKEQDRFRGVCVKSGFMSVAVAPIRYNNKILGAIHLADKEIGKIEVKKVEFVESLTPLIAEMINKYNVQDQIKNSEEKYRELVENANSIILRLDALGRITFFNEFAQKFFGFSAEEIIGKNSVGTIVPQRDSKGEDLEKMIKNIIKYPKRFERNENENIKKDGSKVWVTWTNKAVFDEKGKLLHVLCIGNDITEKKRSEEAEKKASRALKMLTECSHALIHGKNEQVLLHEICRTIVETGGYLMAWVGEARQDDYKSVVSIAQSGFEDGYLKTANVSWSRKTVKGRGPTGTAIREKRIAIGKNFHKDRKLIPWRERATKRGYASSIALPLESDGEVFGSLTIYAAKPYAFENKEEVKLLEQLASDISFGVTALRVKKSREKAEEQLVESYRHLGIINRKISLLLDLEQHGTKKNKKDVAQYIMDSAVNLSRASVGAIYRLEENKHFCLLAQYGMTNAQKKRVRKIHCRDCGTLRFLIKQKRMIKGMPKEHGLGKLNFENKLKYFVMLPLGLEKKPSGFLFLGFTDRKSMDSQELEFLNVFSVHTSSALFSAGILKYN